MSPFTVREELARATSEPVNDPEPVTGIEDAWFMQLLDEPEKTAVRLSLAYQETGGYEFAGLSVWWTTIAKLVGLLDAIEVEVALDGND